MNVGPGVVVMLLPGGASIPANRRMRAGPKASMEEHPPGIAGREWLPADVCRPLVRTAGMLAKVERVRDAHREGLRSSGRKNFLASEPADLVAFDGGVWRSDDDAAAGHEGDDAFRQEFQHGGAQAPRQPVRRGDAANPLAVLFWSPGMKETLPDERKGPLT
jgi:hypothetical protein